MPTIAELTLQLDARPIDQGTKSLNNLADASQKVTKALKDQKKAQDDLNANPPGGGGNGGGGGNPKPINDISSAIDYQTRKLKELEEQRKKLNASDLKTTNPAEYARLNQILDSRVEIIRRQGNALDELSAKEEKERKRIDALAEALRKQQEAQARAVASREALAERAAQKEQKQLDTTLAGLSAQIKAQQDYARTIEQLNRARVTQGMMGAGGMSSAEYDTYVKLAEAKLRDAMATTSNGAELERLRSKLDSVTATLGKTERATIQYSRDLAILNKALQEGILTTDQYNQKLTAITNKRDTSIAKANDTSAAEARIARELKNTMSAYDPVLRATDAYNASVKILADGLQNGKLSVVQFNKALSEQVKALDQVKAAQPNSVESQAARYQAAIDRLLPYNAQLRNLAEAEKALQQAQQAGRVVTQQQIADHQKATEALAAERKEIERRMDASRRAGNSAKQDAAAMRGLPAQFTDIVVSLQGGQAPLTVLLQQGGQIKDMFGGIGNAFKAFGTYLLSLINPLSVVGATLATLGVTAALGAQELVAFNKAVVAGGGYSGTSAGEFSKYREQLDGIVGTAGKAAEVLTQLEASGRVAGDMFLSISEAAIKMERATGESVDKIVEDFISIGKDPVAAAVRLDEKYRFLTAATLAQADALVKMGDQQGAVKLIQGEMAATASSTAEKMIEQAGYIEHAWVAVKDVIKETWDALKGIGRGGAAGTAAELARKEAELASLNSVQSGDDGSKNRLRALGFDVSDNRKKQLETEITQLKQRTQMESYIADLNAESERKRVESNKAQEAAIRRYQNSMEGVERAKYNLDQTKLEIAKIEANGPLTEKQKEINTANLNYAEKKLKEAQEKANKPGRAGALDTTSIQDVKSNLTQINAEYDGYYKRVTALGEANVVSQEATYNSQKSILEAQKNVVASSYDEQIAAINKLKENKKNSTAQNISLDNQLTKAEAAKAKALEDIDTRLDVLQTKENGRIQERTRNIAAYKAALDAQLESLRDEGARNADAVGRGSRQGALNQRLGDEDRDFNKKQLALANALAAKEIDNVEYDEKLKELERNHTDMTKQILQNDKDIQNANLDWTNGFTAAVEDAKDAGMDFAGSVNQALTGAFQSAGDALFQFVTTGKLSFSDFASSVINDMARIASQQAANGLLSALLGVGMSAAGNYFGGMGATTTGVSGAGSFGQIGGQYTGTGVFAGVQAQGGAWSGGTQYFANGGAFTNSVVSNPTSFGMANGAKGVMGEAGPEAIVPLARTRNGDLGVRMTGEGGGGDTTVVNVTVNVTESGSSTSTDGGDGMNSFGQRIGQFVRQEIYTVINKETRPGGSLQSQNS